MTRPAGTNKKPWTCLFYLCGDNYLAKDVEDRYQNAIDLHDDLQAWMYSARPYEQVMP